MTELEQQLTNALTALSEQYEAEIDLPPGTSPLSKLDLGPFEVHSMV